MAISNFSSLLELATALNAAYIAVDLSNGYTKMLSEKVFNFTTIIINSFEKHDEFLCKSETITNLKPMQINTKSTHAKLESCKRDFEKLASSIIQKKDSLKSTIGTRCESKNFPSLSLSMFLYGVIALFFCGFDDNKLFIGISDIFFVILGILLLIYLLFGWINSDKIARYCKIFDYTSLYYSIITFVICTLLTLFLTFLVFSYNFENNELLKSIIKYGVPVFMFIPFLNFLVFLFIIKQRKVELKALVEQEANLLLVNCEKINKDVEILVSANMLDDMITG